MKNLVIIGIALALAAMLIVLADMGEPEMATGWRDGLIAAIDRMTEKDGHHALLKIVEAAEQTGEWWVYIDPFGMEREIMEVEDLE